MADWTAKADPFLKTAELENRANINERTLAGNVATSVTAAERLAENARQADQKNEVANIRAAAYKLKQERYEIKVEGDSVVGYGPHNERVILGPSGGLDAADKINLEGSWNVKAAEARGEAGVKIAQAAGTAGGKDLIEIDGIKYRLSPDGTEYLPVRGLPKGTATRPGPAVRTPAVNTLETRRQINDQLKSDYQTSPDAKKFIKRKSDGTYDFADRPQAGPATGVWPFNNKDAVTPEQVEQYDQYRRSVDPSYVPPTTKPGGVGGSMGSGKEEAPAKAKGLAPSGLAPGASIGTGPGGYTPQTASPQYQDINLPSATKDAPHKVVGQVSANPDPVRRQLEQRAIGYLSKNNLPVTAANIEYAIKTGRLAR
jgi:hypothetical protein